MICEGQVSNPISNSQGMVHYPALQVYLRPRPPTILTTWDAAWLAAGEVAADWGWADGGLGSGDCVRAGEKGTAKHHYHVVCCQN